jgi:hypothetical protein
VYPAVAALRDRETLESGLMQLEDQAASAIRRRERDEAERLRAEAQVGLALGVDGR